MTPLSRIRRWLRPRRQRLSELIGRAGLSLSAFLPRIHANIDYSQSDYQFWDELRRGKLWGFEIGGLFARPIAQILTAWTIGDGLTVDSGNETTNAAISDFLNDELQTLVAASEDHLALGDSYVVVNADGSLQQVSAAQVAITPVEGDIHRIQKAVITTRDVQAGYFVEDEYTAEQRTLRTRKIGFFGGMGDVEREQVFPNLIGRIPIVHFANDRGPDEVYGHPYYEELMTLFAEYDDVTRKALGGVKLMGNPIPALQGVEDPAQARQDNTTYSDDYVDRQGSTRSDDVTEIAPHEMIYTSGKFELVAPGSFTSNTTDMLKKLFQLMLQNSQIPEWAWGGAIASSNASVDAQLPAFARFILGRRRKIQRPVLELLKIWLATIALFTPGIAADADLSAEWPELVPGDDEIKLKWVQFLDTQNYLSKATVVRLSELVDDPEAEIEQAEKEAKEAENEFNQRVDDSISRLMAGDAMGMDDERMAQNGNGNGNRQAA